MRKRKGGRKRKEGIQGERTELMCQSDSSRVLLQENKKMLKSSGGG